MGKRSREKLARRSLGEGGREERKFEFRTGLEKTCLFIIRWGTYLVLFTPLIINTNFFFPFVAPKTIFFRIIVEILLATYLFLVISNQRYRPRINALTIAITLFLGIFILTSFTGINLERSFWSTNERMTGILTMLHLFAFFIILSSVFKRREDWEKILGVSIIVGVILSLYILMSDQISSRGGGTIGNTSFMAAYLLFDIFFAIILFLSKRGAWQIFSGISLLIMLPVLFTSTARGAIVSFLGGLFLLFLGYLIFSQRKKLKRMALAIILLLVVFAATSAIFQPAFITNKVENTFRDMGSRFVVWEKGWKGFLERPILGWGPENFNVVFLKYYNPCMSLGECGGEIWFDRAHNIVFDTLVTTGIIGLLSYLSIFGIAIYELLKTLPKIMDPVRSSLETRNNLDFSERSGKYGTSNGVKRKNVFIPLGLAALLMVYFFQNLLVFDMINTYLVFFLSLAFISFLIQKPPPEKEPRVKSVNPVLGFPIVIATIFILWAGNIQPAIANHYLIKTISSQSAGESAEYFQKSLNSWMEKYEPREQFAQKMIRAPYQSMEDKESFQKAFAISEAEMEKSCEENSLDFRPHLFLGGLYSNSYRFSGNKEKLEKAEEILQKAIQLSPTNQQGYWHLAEIRIVQGRAEEAILLLQRAIELEPRVARSHWYLAMAYRIADQNQLALEKIIEAEKLGYDWKRNLTELERGINVYFALKDDKNLVPLYLKAIEMSPNDAQLWASLAASYANLGQFDKAKDAVKKVMELNPDLAPKVEEFLKSLPQ